MTLFEINLALSLNSRMIARFQLVKCNGSYELFNTNMVEWGSTICIGGLPSFFYLVSMKGLEPSWVASLEPKPSAYTNSATSTWEYPPLVSGGGSRGIPPLSHMGWFSDSFFSRRCEPGCIPVPYSQGWIWTSDQPINSRRLCHWATWDCSLLSWVWSIVCNTSFSTDRRLHCLLQNRVS